MSKMNRNQITEHTSILLKKYVLKSMAIDEISFGDHFPPGSTLFIDNHHLQTGSRSAA